MSDLMRKDFVGILTTAGLLGIAAYLASLVFAFVIPILQSFPLVGGFAVPVVMLFVLVWALTATRVDDLVLRNLPTFIVFLAGLIAIKAIATTFGFGMLFATLPAALDITFVNTIVYLLVGGVVLERLGWL